ncbi:MAG: rhodanese-like domain-containing protein [Acidimicrobiaceae bacterium]|nr:rhodanese-like domain-containing protein [Acidimicrobiaceae bacterium]
MGVKSVNEMVAEAKTRIDNISPAEAHRRVTEEGALIVDIRDVRELQRDGAIVGSTHAPRGMLEFWVSPDSPYTKAEFQEGRELILSCAAGGRSALSADTLQDMGMAKVSHIETGFAGWRADGFAVTDYDTFRSQR